MKTVAPNYYEKFHCIANKCKHSCCIGWEIDIDEDALDFYQSIGGAFGEKLKQNIEKDEETAHFRLLGKEERCPFLQENGLCEMILTLGEQSLCDICREHPRFYHVLSDRDEIGLGLCCEEATRLILSQEEDTVLEVIDDDDYEDTPTEWEQALLSRRGELFSLLQNRSMPLEARAKEMLTLAKASVPEKTPQEWYEVFRSLEQLDPSWEIVLSDLCHLQNDAFDEWEKPFEKLLLYFLYRHTAKATDHAMFSARVAFSYLSYHIIRLLCAAQKEKVGTCSFEYLLDLARRYSSEIEYSEENTEALLQKLI